MRQRKIPQMRYEWGEDALNRYFRPFLLGLTLLRIAA